MCPPPATPVTAYHSPTATRRRYHLDPAGCPALEGMREAGGDPLVELATQDFPDVDALAADATGRLCRKCAQEPVLAAVLPARGQEPVVFAAFSSQPPEAEAFTPVRRQRSSAYSFDGFSDTGAQRLAQLAVAAGLSLTRASCGPVAFGMVPQRAVPALAANLRAQVRPQVRALPDPALVATAWSLLTQDPPVLRAYYQERGVAVPSSPDPWLVAELIHSPAAGAP